MNRIHNEKYRAIIQRLSQWAGIVLAVLVLLLAIGPQNVFYFIHAPAIMLVLGLTGFGLLAAFGLRGYGDLMRWLAGGQVG